MSYSKEKLGKIFFKWDTYPAVKVLFYGKQ